jgi:hypothetical protein
MKPRILFILMASSFLGGLAPAADIYLAPRTDGRSGSGTRSDPYDASSPSKFDALLQRFPTNTVFHYASGVYETTGYHFRSGNAGTNCVHRGAGIDQTIIRLVADSGGDNEALIFGVDYSRTCSGFQVTNMTLDCNAANYPTFTQGGPQPAAINVQGNNILIKSVKVIGFGTGKIHSECFPVTSRPGQVFAGQSFSNIHVENCIFTNPATGNQDGVSVVSLGSDSPDVQVTDTAILNCQFVNLASDFLYVHAMNAALCRGNYVQGSVTALENGQFITGFYDEPATIETQPVTITNNTFKDVFSAASINFHPTGGFGDFTFSNNTVILPNAFNIFSVGVNVWNQNSGRPTIKSITVDNNVFGGDPNTDPAYYRAVDESYYPPSILIGTLTIAGNQFQTAVPSGREFDVSADQVQTLQLGTNTYSNGGTVPITYTP